MSAARDPDDSPSSGAPQQKLARFLSEIDPETLPEENFWEEVRQRFEAFEQDRRGWRTGNLDHRLDDFGGEK